VRQLLPVWREHLDERAEGLANPDLALADLASWLGLRRRGLGDLQSGIGWFFDHYAAALTVLGLLATAFYGLAYATFYHAVDSSPEQVGVTTTQILAQSAVGGIAFVAFGGLVVLAYFAPYVPVIAALDVVEGYAGKSQYLKLVGFSASVCVGWLLVLGTTADGGIDAEIALLAVVWFVVAPLLLGLRYGKARGIHLAPLHFRIRDFGVFYLACATVALVVLGVATFFAADEDGKKASEGERIGSSGIAGISYLGLKAEPAFLTWRGEAPAEFHLPRCVLYLGHSDGAETVYDYHQRRTMQLPESAVIVTIRQDRSSCAAPINEEKPIVRKLRAEAGLVCEPGRWTAYPHPRYRYRWIRDGFEMNQTASNSLTLHERDVDQSFRCAVEASTSLGSDVAYSRYFVPGRGRRSSEVVPGAKRAPG